MSQPNPLDLLPAAARARAAEVLAFGTPIVLYAFTRGWLGEAEIVLWGAYASAAGLAWKRHIPKKGDPVAYNPTDLPGPDSTPRHKRKRRTG